MGVGSHLGNERREVVAGFNVHAIGCVRVTHRYHFLRTGWANKWSRASKIEVLPPLVIIHYQSGIEYNGGMNAILIIGLVGLIVGLAGLAVVMVVHGYFRLRNRVPYVVLPAGAMAAVVSKVGVRDTDVVYDLGCGDGRVIAALQRDNPKAKYVGVENDVVVWGLAMRRLGRTARLIRGEIADSSLSEATRVFAYLGPKMMAELEPRFERELPKGARVVSVQFALPTRPADEVVELTDSASHAARLYVYNY